MLKRLSRKGYRLRHARSGLGQMWTRTDSPIGLNLRRLHLKFAGHFEGIGWAMPRKFLLAAPLKQGSIEFGNVFFVVSRNFPLCQTVLNGFRDLLTLDYDVQLFNSEVGRKDSG